MKRLLPVIFIIILAIGLSIGANYLNKTTQKNEINTSQMEVVNNVLITYYYYSPELIENAAKLHIEIKDNNEIKLLTKSLENLDITDYSDKVGLVISGNYQVDFENGTKILFDSNNDQFATLINNEKKSLIKVPIELKDSIIKKVDVKLTERAKQYETDKITIEQEGIDPIEISDKYALEKILENCKNIANIKNLDLKNFEKNYVMNFNEDIKIEVFAKGYIGKLLKKDEKEQYVMLPIELVDIIQNRINNEKNEKVSSLFNTDKIIIEHNEKAIEINEIEKIEPITQRLIYSKISHLNYLDSETFKIETTPEDYILEINGNRIIIYGSANYASRQVIYEDGSYDDITFMNGLEEYIKSLTVIKE